MGSLSRFAEAGAPVVAVARTGPALAELAEALLKPLPPGSRVVVVSSGAAINGSPASGGYAGSKATQRFIAGYAQDESRRAGLDITVTAVMPRMTPLGDVGRRGGSGVRGPWRPDRGGLPQAAGRPVDPRDGRVGPSGPVTGRPSDHRSRVPAHRRRAAEAAMNTGAALWRCVILSVVGALAWWLS